MNFMHKRQKIYSILCRNDVLSMKNCGKKENYNEI